MALSRACDILYNRHLICITRNAYHLRIESFKCPFNIGINPRVNNGNFMTVQLQTRPQILQSQRLMHKHLFGKFRAAPRLYK